ncbi:MAG: hypothetical protein NC418_02490 [Muribaculaceae bacterium]|nr:hypothetical protein [Muribaculaceae bacterium]
MAEKSLYLHRRTVTTDMRITTDIVLKANARTMANASRFRNADAGRYVSEDGTIQVGVRYHGKLYTQRITPQQLNSSFGKAYSSHVKKI